MADRAQRVVLPDGTEVWARVSRFDGVGGGADGFEDGFEDVSVWDTVTTRVEGMRELVAGVAASVRDATRAAAPDETSVTFGVEVAARPGKAVALLAGGEVKANLSVTLTWHHGAPREEEPSATAPAARPVPDAEEVR
ncbi:CU044_2847 family protein [Streptomyces sp. NPDC059740]|uniref:CU044_2847 family protein n=1 Tax=Streptomyces sp. NPDC059740 TaxID=3346926 RepID=UPI0036497A6E